MKTFEEAVLSVLSEDREVCKRTNARCETILPHILSNEVIQSSLMRMVALALRSCTVDGKPPSVAIAASVHAAIEMGILIGVEMASLPADSVVEPPVH